MIKIESWKHLAETPGNQLPVKIYRRSFLLPMQNLHLSAFFVRAVFYGISVKFWRRKRRRGIIFATRVLLSGHQKKEERRHNNMWKEIEENEISRRSSNVLSLLQLIRFDLATIHTRVFFTGTQKKVPAFYPLDECFFNLLPLIIPPKNVNRWVFARVPF